MSVAASDDIRIFQVTAEECRRVASEHFLRLGIFVMRW
jgi:hypothetical protein